MKQEIVKKELGGHSFTKRGKENKIISNANKFIKEINEKGGEVVKYEIRDKDRIGKNISIIFLVNWD